MMRRPVRILILLLTVAVTAGVVWKATTNEQARGRMRMAAQQNDAAAADAVYALADLRSSLHAYVAPGQGIDFWSKRAEAQLDSLGSRLRDLEPAAAAANHSLSTALSSLDGLADSEKRARSAMRNSLPLVAGDIVFDDARDRSTRLRAICPTRGRPCPGSNRRERPAWPTSSRSSPAP